MSGHGRRVLIAENGGALHALAAVRALGAPRAGAPASPSRVRQPAAARDRVDRGGPPGAASRARSECVCRRDRGLRSVRRVRGRPRRRGIELVALSAGRDRLPCAVPHAPHPALLRAIDKLLLTEAAARAGLAVPATRPATAEHLEELDGPVYVKARLHWRPDLDGDDRHLLARRCASRREAAAYAQWMAAAGRAAAAGADRGRGHGDHRGVRPRRPARGVVPDARTLRLALRRSRAAVPRPCRSTTSWPRGVVRLLADLGWSGVANVQFVRPPGTPAPHRPQRPALREPRAAYAAGVNVPDLWARIGLGESVGELAIGRPGVRFEAFEDDVERAREERRGGLARDLADVAWSALRAPQWRHALRDPAPATNALSERVMRRVRRQ